MTDSKNGDPPPGRGPKGTFAPKGTLVMEAVPPRQVVAHPAPVQQPAPLQPYPPAQQLAPPGPYPQQPLPPGPYQQAQAPVAAPGPYAPHAQQPAPAAQAWPGQPQAHAAGWAAAGAMVSGLPTVHAGASHAPGICGDHWPLPEALLQRLPQLPIVQPMDAHDAEVQFSGSGSAIEWLTYAAEVNERDNEAERIKKQLFIWAMVCLVGGVLTVALFGLGLIPIGVSIYLFIRRKRYDKVDVDDRRLEIFTGTVRTLAPELKAKKPITVILDFTAHTRHVRNAAKHASEYEQQWLSLKLPLQDGCHAQMTVTVQVKERSKPKRKYTKIKRKQLEQIVVRLTPASGTAFSPNPRAHQVAGRSVNGLTLRQVMVQPHLACFTWSSWVSVTVRARGGWTSHTPPLDSRHLVTTLIVSYKLARAAEREAA